MKAFSFEYTIRVRYFDTDKMGYVHNSNYFRYFEIGREETSRAAGLCYDEVEHRGVMMPLIEQHIHYHIPAVYDENIIVKTTIPEMPTAKVRYEYEVYSIREGKKVLHADGSNVLCFVDINTRKPIRCPQWLKDVYANVLSVDKD